MLLQAAASLVRCSLIGVNQFQILQVRKLADMSEHPMTLREYGNILATSSLSGTCWQAGWRHQACHYLHHFFQTKSSHQPGEA